MLHFDYPYLSESDDDEKYVFVVKDDSSGYSGLSAELNASWSHAAEVLSRWQRTFTAFMYWVSDRGAHFMNYLPAFIAKDFNIHHKHTVIYCDLFYMGQWNGGAV